MGEVLGIGGELASDFLCDSFPPQRYEPSYRSGTFVSQLQNLEPSHSQLRSLILFAPSPNLIDIGESKTCPSLQDTAILAADNNNIPELTRVLNMYSAAPNDPPRWDYLLPALCAAPRKCKVRPQTSSSAAAARQTPVTHLSFCTL